MATLYSQSDSNIRKTWALMVAFFLFFIAVGWVFSRAYNNPSLLYFAVIFSSLTSVGSYWYSDKLVLAMSHAQEVKHNESPEIYHIVENLCITAGLPTPKIYILPEAQPNAFATGRNEKHAVVAVTQGLLQKLDKTELEGVIAHELSHIKNKDMLLQTIVVVMAGALALISDWFLRMSFLGGVGSRDDRNKGGGGVMMLIGLAAAILAPIAAMLIQLAISRKREFLADASGALLTRYPEGLAAALEKISSDPNPMRFANKSTAHLYISSPLKSNSGQVNAFTKLFMTHPPIQERIAALRGLKV